MARTYSPARRRSSGPRANKYPGECAYCGDVVPAGDGLLRRQYGGHGPWQVFHRPVVWHGSPVSGRWVNGCPGEADKLNSREVG